MTPQELDNMRRSELLTLAKKIGVKGFSRLTKSELIQNVLEAVEKGGDVLKKEINKFMKQSSGGSTVEKTVKKAETPAATRTKTATGAQARAREVSASDESPGAETPEPVVAPKVALNVHPRKEPTANEPADEPDAEAQARTSIAAMRYADPPLYQRGQLVLPEQLRDIDSNLPDLPIGYGDGSIHLMPRDPKWLFCYWDVSEEKRASSGKYGYGRLYLRLHDVTHVIFNGTNSWSVHQFALNEEARWWYIPVPAEGRHFMAELGYRMPDGTWNSLGTSDAVIPPPGSQSPWVHDVFVSLPFDQPLPVAEGAPARWLENSLGEGRGIPDRHELPQPPLWGTPVNPPSLQPFHFGVGAAPTSPGVSSFVQIRNDKNDLLSEFPLVVNAALRVFGATSPEVHLEIDGLPHELAADGTFTVAFPFPDGSQAHRVTARGVDGTEKTVQISFHRSAH
ncbi:MAG: hypothetical protein CVU59_04115 [Deltaproteobacteria bacterium HGW-Deltaproteobacteria-17]|nr:MAG: hypothetical protein CVU59_04115 [Deltaproteobacteria bacterium HGW-Deltaproteobacteria-17]